MWENCLSGSVRGWGTTEVWPRYCGTTGKPGGKPRTQTLACSDGSPQSTISSPSMSARISVSMNRRVLDRAQAAYPDLRLGHDRGLGVGRYAAGGLLVHSRQRRQATHCIHGSFEGGKTALLAAGFDERITLVVPNGSGAGGAGSYRVQGEKAESLGAITDPQRFSYWFHPRLRTFVGKENRLPFDQHFLEALVAPRALLVADASGDL